MSLREREGLIARIRHMRRIAELSSARAGSSSTRPDENEFLRLEDRITHLESLVQGLQDSVHRESKRQGERIAELEARTHPAELAQALSKDARNRGL